MGQGRFGARLSAGRAGGRAASQVARNTDSLGVPSALSVFRKPLCQQPLLLASPAARPARIPSHTVLPLSLSHQLGFRAAARGESARLGHASRGGACKLNAVCRPTSRKGRRHKRHKIYL